MTHARHRLATLRQSHDRIRAYHSLLHLGMALRVEWKETAARSLGEHGVRWDEAATVLGDPFSRTIANSTIPDGDDSCFVTIGLSNRARMLLIEHIDYGYTVRIISARRAVQKSDVRHQSRLDYDFRNGVRGKYVSRYWEAAALSGPPSYASASATRPRPQAGVIVRRVWRWPASS